MIPDAPNMNRLWADLIVEELVRSGIDFFCVAPGSRSTPLATAIAAHPRARRIVHFDERGTAFAALGYARATGHPAAWVTTSGTAAANGLPAVVEAATDGVPMLLLTADRPPELRHTGANQTIEQPNLFGTYVRWQFDLPVPTEEMPPEALLTTIDQAAYRAIRAPQGPVHLNLMFREPLAPVREERSFEAYLSGVQRWLGEEEPYTCYARTQPSVDEAEIRRISDLFRTVERGIITAGKLDGTDHRDAVLRLGKMLSWPILPDVGSHLRLGGTGGAVASYHDQVLMSSVFADSHRPEAILHIGGRLTSKRLLQFVEQSSPIVYVSVRNEPSRLDPSHRVTHAVEAEPVAFCDRLANMIGDESGQRGRTSWLLDWEAASNCVNGQVEAFLNQDDGLSEPRVARIISGEIQNGHGLFLASSMPIRDMDMYADSRGAFVRVATNRGASGIDGTIASAAGYAFGLQAPVTLVIGDLAFLHDLNSLSILRRLEFPVTVVVINNDGGGIFSFLPIARFDDVFEPYFGTPHGLSFEHAATLFGIRYERPATASEFSKVYRAASTGREATIIEITSDRRTNYALHQALQRRVTEHLS